MRKRSARLGVVGAVVAIAAISAAIAVANTITGPSSSDPPYVVRSEPGVVTKSILTVGDSVGGYRMVGIPDGLGAFDNGDGTFTVLMNHELAATVGTVRAHGAKGAFISKWTIAKGSLEVRSGQDLIQEIATWNSATSSYNAHAKGIAMGRLCSADLPAISAFYDAASGLGYSGRLFMDGEEVGNEGRGFAHALDGRSWEVPALGKFSWENSVANPGTGAKTAVVGLDDTTPGQVYVYIGSKKAVGLAGRAGRPHGRDALRRQGVGLRRQSRTRAESRQARRSSCRASATGRTRPARRSKPTAIRRASRGSSVRRTVRGTRTDPSTFYFVTTNGFNQPSRLWRLNFADPANLAAGGTIDMLLDGTEGQQMFDNMTANDRGQVLIQEDPGNQAYIARVWRYSPDSRPTERDRALRRESVRAGRPGLLHAGRGVVGDHPGAVPGRGLVPAGRPGPPGEPRRGAGRVRAVARTPRSAGQEVAVSGVAAR